MQSRPLKLSTPRDRRFRAARYRVTVIRRERLREEATKAIAQHGLAGANLRAIAAAADMETGAVRNYYFGTPQAMMEDLARWHQQRLGEAMTEVVIAARGAFRARPAGGAVGRVAGDVGGARRRAPGDG